MPTLEGSRRAEGLQFAVVVSRYNDFVTERLLIGAREALAAAGVADEDVTVLRVPGAYELPLAAQRAAGTGRFAGVVALGCLIRGATPHFEYIASACAHGITAAAASTGVPMSFGVLTTNSVEEALERAAPGPSNKGKEAADAAVEMARLYAVIGDPPLSRGFGGTSV
jgi:6,7-dimethyl-8-ribityllumazine synthase